jgi:acyl carrier protein
MGLDVVQLVMNLEERYGFIVPDADAREMRSVGDLHKYILAHAEPRPL